MQIGLYEQIIDKALATQLQEESRKNRTAITEGLDSEEAPKILARYLAEVFEKQLQQIRGDGEEQTLQKQISFVNDVMEQIHQEASTVDSRAELLKALFDRGGVAVGEGNVIPFPCPATSLARSSLFTGAVHEPLLYSELKKEILSSDRIDILVSFIKWSGLRLIINELVAFVERGGVLRVITTSYMGATDLKAVDELEKLPNTQIKISYDTKRTRLHAKTYVFYRKTGFSTSYVGSSNLSNAAISSGLEWNIKVTAKDLPETVEKIEATFESYWNSADFVDYLPEERAYLAKALRGERLGQNENPFLFNFEITPYPYQQEILDKLQAEREIHGFMRNLIVAATGTGKTVLAAFDYKRYRDQKGINASRLLFVAHREEILKQSVACFRGVLGDANFGDLWVGDSKPEELKHLFVSVQTLHSQQLLKKLPKDYYHYVVVDEFHHAAAPTYETLLTHCSPQILLGLTATPERMDGKSVISYFGNRIAAEIRLPEAINRKLLSPFQYFGVSDSEDLRVLKWSRGGYDRSELSRVYTGNDVRLRLVLKALSRYVTDLNDVKGIGFCVSKEHARYMAESFTIASIPSIFLTADSPDEERRGAKEMLVGGEVRFIFVVDLYNEGVDIPEINTLLFLRPTESLTIFLQQLGRGLRLSKDKDCLTVLDFIGQANKRYSFQEKFQALLEHTRNSVKKEIEEGFNALPRGCFIQLEKKAAGFILENIHSALGNRQSFIAHIANFSEDTGKELTLQNFLEHYHLDAKQMYQRGSFSRLCVLAGIKTDFEEALEEKISKAMPKLSAIDSRRWLDFLLHFLPSERLVVVDPEKQQMLRMFHHTIWGEEQRDLFQDIASLRLSPILFSEILELLRHNLNKINFLDRRILLPFPCPLDLHCTYTRDQILVAMGFMKTSSVREGVKFLADKNVDLLFVTLNKSEKEYSPTTMYRDYSINQELFHWQSQSIATPESATGKRYTSGTSTVLLFVREFKSDSFGVSPYTFLGKCCFVQSEGSRPMNIVWRLEQNIPAKYLKKTNKLMVG